jgi:tRNA pseudouridine38-40 synthase
MVLEFDGTDFAGWQRQLTGERTVQGVLEEAAARIPGGHSPVRAAGRTDAGVHALALVAHFDTDCVIPDEKLRLALNAHLPRDVAVLQVDTASPDFESQFDCTYRRYVYRLRMVRGNPRGLALDRNRVLAVHRPLDVPAMQAAARFIEGRHDFAAFATQESRTTVREVFMCELREERGELRLHIAGEGFLRNMVRTIVGTLLWVGSGKLQPLDVPAVIESLDRTRAGHNVAPWGLYFVEAGYLPWDALRSEQVTAARLLF